MDQIAQVELAAPHDVSMLALFLEAGVIVQAVMIGLLLASVWTWAIVIDKLGAFARARRRARDFEDEFWSGASLEELYQQENVEEPRGPAAIFVAAMGEWKKSHEKGARSPIGLQTRIEKAMDVALGRETERLEARLGSLATIGSAAPFVGLFGTVIGIMTSFQAIAGSKSTNLAVVAPGIAEALLATAIGLLAAIPAVIAYNKLSGDANKIGAKLEGFADEFSAILSRQVDERESARAMPRAAAPQQPAAPAQQAYARQPAPQQSAPHHAAHPQAPHPNAQHTNAQHPHAAQGYAQAAHPAAQAHPGIHPGLAAMPQHADGGYAPAPQGGAATLHRSSADPQIGY